MDRGPVMRAHGVGTHAEDQRNPLPAQPGFMQPENIELLLRAHGLGDVHVGIRWQAQSVHWHHPTLFTCSLFTRVSLTRLLIAVVFIAICGLLNERERESESASSEQ